MEPLTIKIKKRVHHAKKTLHTDDRFIDWVMRELLGASDSKVAYHDAPGLFENMTGDEHWELDDTACIGVSGGVGDEHPVNGQTAKTGKSASSLWLEKFGVDDPALARLAEYCRRNDAEGYHQGQEDLASILQALNYCHPQVTEEEIQLFADYIFTALYWREKSRLEAFNTEFPQNALVANITPEIYIAAIQSDNPAIQWAANKHGVALTIRRWSNGHMKITPKAQMIPRWIMDEVAIFVRRCEMQAQGIPVPKDLEILKEQGNVPEVPEWYYYNGVLHTGYPTRPGSATPKATLNTLFKVLTQVLRHLANGGAR